MPSYTASLKLVQPTTGEYPGSWGSQVNTSLTALVDVAVAGTTSITMTAANYTLTNANGVADEAKSMFLVLGGTPGGSHNVIVPTASKLYFVTNSTGFAQTVKTSAGSGISVPNGARIALRCDGTDVLEALNYVGSLTLGSPLVATSGGTGQSLYAVGDLLFASTTTALSKLAGVVTGNALISGGVGAAPSYGKIGLATHVSGTLPTANGGTNLTTFTANGLVYASSTSALTTSSAATFDGTDFATTGTVSAAKLLVTGGTAAGNSMYLSGTDRVSISTGGNERFTITSVGNVGIASTPGSTVRLSVNTATASNTCALLWNSATSGDNVFAAFGTESPVVIRGSIDYNRTGGLTRYNTTSDYRAKDILGPVSAPGATIDALKIYEGRMKGATQSRPMLVAHEVQEHLPYAVSGVKDEVNEDGTPKFQQIDVSSLVPLLLAEIQALRARVAALEQT
jgi:hypothetical protein